MGLESENKKGNYKRITLLVVYIIVLFIIYFILVDMGINPVILIIILVFIFLVTIGLFFRRKKGSLYKEIFPSKSSKESSLNDAKNLREEKEVKHDQRKVFKPITLSSKHYKPIVLKCKSCRNIIPNFVKKCPFCSKEVK